MIAARALSNSIRAAPVRWASAGTRTPHPITSNGRPSVIQNLAHRNAEFKKATLNDPGVYPLLACLACGAALGVTQLVRYMRFGPDVKFDRRKRQAEIPYDEDEAVAWMNGVHKRIRGEQELDKIHIPPFKY